MDVSSLVRAFIQEELLPHAPAQPVDDDTQLMKGLIDSAGLFQLVTYLEEEFGVEILDAEISDRRLATPADIVRLVMSKLSTQSGASDQPQNAAAQDGET